MITDEALYPINHAWRVHWAADSSGLMRPSIIDARFNDESASESIAEQHGAAVNTHLIRDTDAIFHDDFRFFFKSVARGVPDFSQALPIYRSQLRGAGAFYTTRVESIIATFNSDEISGPAILIVAIQRCSEKQYGYIHEKYFHADVSIE